MLRWLLAVAALFSLIAVSFVTAQDLPDGTARVHYQRPDGAYEGFELHVWEDTTEEVTWEEGLEPDGEDDYGVYWDVALTADAETLGFIVHKGDEKDPGPDLFLDLTEGREVWIVSGNETLFREQPGEGVATAGDLSKAQAHWLTPELMAWQVGEVTPDTRFMLHSAAGAGLELTPNGLSGGDTFPLVLDETGLPEAVLEQFPHLADYAALRLEETAEVTELLRGQVAVAKLGGDELVEATSLQIPGVLDTLYADAAQDTTLGVSWDGDTPNVAVWAPTAQTVRLHVFEQPADEEADSVLEMSREDSSGVWSVAGQPDWKDKYYLFEVTVYAPTTRDIVTNLVTDPYSVSLSTNSTKSQFVDLSDASLKPEGWDTFEKPSLESFNDIMLYELHMRDFSVGDEGVPAEQQGTYLAFTHPDTDGMTHLRELVEAGITHLHLLPTFDIATINEDKSSWQEPAADLDSLPPASSEQQEAVSAVRDEDGFNWGYDPYHYNVPEGSYATDPQGATRVKEYRQMVQGLAGIGLRTVMDVVYNHTNSSAQAEKSVLDKVVPGYYHRLNAEGAVETSTCCQNTATEHAMMRKLMVDSVVLWAKEYKVDGFRFDLMGHHMVEDMLAVREALDALTLETDGVDGKNIYLYGEGWDFGEVAGNARGVNATQANLAGSGIGTFNDRLRDAVRGGGPFDEGADLVTNQGFTNGLYYLPNEQAGTPTQTQLEDLLKSTDQIRVGLAGNLAAYTFTGSGGEEVTGQDIDYNGSPAGYTQLPQENILYVSAHDNQTLWDNNQYKLPLSMSTEDRVRAQVVGLSTVALGQGIPFFHAGSELLRSKSFDRNSYNSGDWFNRLDFSYEHNNFGVGLPLADDNQPSWQVMRPRLEADALTPDSADIVTAKEQFETLLRIRGSSPLFRLESAEEVQTRLSFHNTGPEQVPGVIVMRLADVGEGVADLDPEHEQIVVVFNATGERQTLRVDALEGSELSLHPLQATTEDVVTTSAYYSGSSQLSIPAFTTAVFVAPQR